MRHQVGEPHSVLSVGEVVDAVVAVSGFEIKPILALAARETVVAPAAIDVVIAAVATQPVFGRVAPETIIQVTAACIFDIADSVKELLSVPLAGGQPPVQKHAEKLDRGATTAIEFQSIDTAAVDRIVALPTDEIFVIVASHDNVGEIGATVMGDAIIRGTAGGDVLYGGNRNDVFDPLDNGTSTDLDVDRGYDTVYGSRGDDRIIYTRSGEEAFQEAAGTRCDSIVVVAHRSMESKWSCSPTGHLACGTDRGSTTWSETPKKCAALTDSIPSRAIRVTTGSAPEAATTGFEAVPGTTGSKVTAAATSSSSSPGTGMTASTTSATEPTPSCSWVWALERASAQAAMTSIPHVRDSYWKWFESGEYFMSRLYDLLFIGFQKHLSEDFEIIKSRLRLPNDLALPDDDFHSHANPRHLDRTLGDAAVANLHKWYEEDFRFLKLCERVVRECPHVRSGRPPGAARWWRRLVELRAGGTNGGS